MKREFKVVTKPNPDGLTLEEVAKRCAEPLRQLLEQRFGKENRMYLTNAGWRETPVFVETTCFDCRKPIGPAERVYAPNR